MKKIIEVFEELKKNGYNENEAKAEIILFTDCWANIFETWKFNEVLKRELPSRIAAMVKRGNYNVSLKYFEMNVRQNSITSLTLKQAFERVLEIFETVFGEEQTISYFENFKIREKKIRK